MPLYYRVRKQKSPDSIQGIVRRLKWLLLALLAWGWAGVLPSPIAAAPLGLTIVKDTEGNAIVTVHGDPNQFFMLHSAGSLSAQWIVEGGGTLDGTGQFSSTNAMIYSQRYFRAVTEEGPIYSTNIVGYVVKSVTSSGDLIGNPLMPANLSIGAMLADAADGFSVYKVGPGGTPTCANFLGGWSDSSLTLQPGEGFFARNRSASPATLAFVGDVIQGATTNRLSAGYVLCASILPPTGGDLSSTGFPANDGDVILFWNPSIGSLDPAIIYIQGLGWVNDSFQQVYPTPEAGQAFWSFKSASGNWAQAFNFGPGYSIMPPGFAATLELLNFFTFNGAGPQLGRVFDTDTTTPLGSGFRGQLYAGPSSAENSLTAVGSPVPFGGGTAAGYINRGIEPVTGLFANDTIYVQLRVWEASAGANYDAALAASGKTGKSSVLMFTAASGLGALVPPDVNGFASFSVSAPAPPCVTPASGRISLWRGEGNASDWLGLHSGTPLNGATFAPGFIGQAFSFDGIDDYVATGNWAPGNQWTLEAWVNPAGVPSGRHTILGGMLECNDWGLIQENGRFGVSVRPPGGCAFSLLAPELAVVGNWHHVAATCDGLTARLYVNGVFKGSVQVETNYVGTVGGTLLGSEACCPTNLFSGLVDEATVYNRPLFQGEISAIYTAAQSGSCVPPEITAAPGSLALSLGATANFSVAAAGFAPLTYQWQFADANISGATSSSLSIPTVQHANAGLYTVVVTDANGLSNRRSATLTVSDPTRVSGALKREVWLNLPDNFLEGLTNNLQFRTAPDVADIVTSAEAPPFYGNDYGQRLSGFLTPRATENYIFHLASDDRAELYLSSDANPSHAVRIASEPVWNGWRDWTGIQRRTAGENVSAPQPLVAGQSYYLEIVMKEGGGGDHLSLAWRKESGPVPAPGSEPIPGTYLSHNLPGLAPSILAPPQSAIAAQGSSVSFQVLARGTLPMLYQWSRGGTALNGETNPVLTVNAGAGTAGSYSVSIMNSAGSASTASTPATLVAAEAGIVPGSLRREVWTQMSGVLMVDLREDFRFYGTPNQTGTVALFEAPVNVGNRYGQRLSGLIIPPVTGNYTFYISGDDQAELYLSTDSHWANRSLICFEPVWNASRDWTGTTRRPLAENISPPILMQAGVPYYIEALSKEGTGGDNLAVAWRKPGDPVPAAGSSPIPGAYLAHTVPLILPAVTVQPQSQTVLAGDDVVLTVTSSGIPPFTYQWRFNDQDIPNATSITYPLSNLQSTQAGDYRVVISNSYGSTTSAVARITVVPCPNLPSDLVAWWTLDAGGLDFVGGHPGVVGPNILSAAGIVGGAFHWSSFVAAEGVTIPYAPSLDLGAGSGFTIEAWIHPLDASEFRPIAVWTDGAVPGLQLAMNGLMAGGFTRPGALCAALNTNSSTVNLLSAQGILVLGRWQHVAFTYDRPSRLGRLYLDGLEVTSRDFGSTLPDTARTLRLGYVPSQPYRGYLDEVSLFNRPLDSQELRVIFLQGAAGKCGVSSVPTLLTQPAGQVLLAGQSASFSVVATGLPEPSYQWRRNGVDLPGATQSTLTILGVQASDAGGYTVHVSNPLGHVTSQSADLDILSPPFITLQPQNQTVPTGTSVTFVSAASGSAPLDYQWLFEEDAIPGALSPSLVLPNVQSLASGAYRMRASNAHGSATSSPAVLQVLNPPGILDPPVGATVGIGEPAQLCVIASGSPPLRYQWRKNGVNIPGATQPCYSIPLVTPADGGSYSVVIANDVGVQSTEPVSLIVQLTQLAAGDNFADRVLFEDSVVRANNEGATKELGEPDHAGQTGGRSVWYRRLPAGNGIATVRTSGSAFDTLLAVYTGQNVDNLTLVAAGEDEAGFFASEVRFNITEGVEYQIVVDGFDGTSGEFILSWDVEPTPEPLPVIEQQPRGQTVLLGGTALFSVVASGGTLQYQWLLNGAELDGQNGSSLTVPNVTAASVGQYSVRVNNEFGRTVQSQSAVLEIGTDPNAQSLDKISNPTLMALSNPLTDSKTGGLPSHLTGGGGILVGAGVTASQIINTTNSFRQAGEPNHCGRLGGSTRWLVLHPLADGLELGLDARGSAIPTILAVYSRANLLQPLVEVSCASGADSLNGVSFLASSTLDYWIAVEGLDGAQGIIQLNWRLGTPPSLAIAVENSTLAVGDAIRWHVAATDGLPTPHYQWRRDGRDIAGATGAFYHIDQIRPEDAGQYSVLASNALGKVERIVGALTVNNSLGVLAKSDFESGLEGWSVVGDPAASVPQLVAGADARGTYAWHSDQGNPALWYWAAPEIYLGNRSAAYGGSFKFDLVKTSTAQVNSGPVVALLSQGRTLVCTLTPMVGTQWSTYEVPLHEAGGWHMETPAGPAPSRRDLLAMLSAVDQWWILGDYSPEIHSTGLDKIRLVGPAESEVALLTVRMLAGGDVAIEWPENAAAFQLQAASKADANSWLPISTVPLSVDGMRQVIAAPQQGPFFRLRKQ